MAGKLQDVLGIPAAYRLFGKLVAGNARRDYVLNHIKPQPGERVFDLGCGPADILAELPQVEYTGVDLDPHYIDAARKRYGNRGSFYCEDVAVSAVREPGTYDLVMANGLLHHLTDEQAQSALLLASRLLKPSGRLVTLDGVFLDRQSRVARWLLARDRGQYVRQKNSYIALVQSAFGRVESVVRHDLLRIPYTLLVMTCRDPIDIHKPQMHSSKAA